MTGSIKDYTPNFEFIIPEFNITGWHDYLEENFRSIDALFYNLFGINNFKGQWKNSTVYNVDDVVFISEDTSYSGRLVKILVQHTTAGTGNFTEFFTANPSYYELFADATTAQIFAQEAKDWAVKMNGPVENDLYSSKYYADIVNGLSTEITALYNIRNDIQNVNLISTEVVDVSNIKNSVQSVANNTTNINTVANNSSNITTVAESIANVNTNATNINAINTNASNISDIQNAYSNAQSALNSKNLAQEWATSATLVDDTDYSAKYYADQAKSEAESIDVNNIVHKTGNETISGMKTFAGNGWVTCYRNTNVTYDIAPSSMVNTVIVFTDKNGQAMGVLENQRGADNSTTMVLSVKGANGTYAGIPLSIKKFADGTTAAYAPIPNISSNGTDIATTSYINSKFQVVSTLPVNPNSNVYYFIPE